MSALQVTYPASPSVALVAYAGTGKDTLVRELQDGALELTKEVNGTTRWVAHGPAGAATSPMERDLRAVFSPANTPLVRRYALADALKRETHEWLGLRRCPPDAFERHKDTLQCPHPDTGALATIRQHYINFGQARRADDPQVWAKRVAAQIEAEKFKDSPRGLVDVITDFRFDNELLERKYAHDFGEHGQSPIMTMRLFRKEVRIAPKLTDRRLDSEHNLDGLRTHFLLTPPGEFVDAVLMFPQYADYRPMWAINCTKK
jgi:hypothetical protein